MNTEREFLIRQLKETLHFLEEHPNAEVRELLHILPPSYWKYEMHIIDRLEHIEHLLEEKLDQTSLRCALAEEGRAENLLHAIMGIEGRLKEERKHIYLWLSGAEDLIICDPYFFSFKGPNKAFKTMQDYIEFQTQLVPNGLEKLDVFHFPSPNRSIIKNFRAFCRTRRVEMRFFETNEVHDRVIIRNNESAKILGTSFGGLGNKIAFFIDLPGEDLSLFKTELHKIRTKS